MFLNWALDEYSLLSCRKSFAAYFGIRRMSAVEHCIECFYSVELKADIPKQGGNIERALSLDLFNIYKGPESLQWETSTRRA